MVDPISITVVQNATNMTNLSCMCMTRDVAMYWSSEWPLVRDAFFQLWSNSIGFAFFVGIAVGVILYYLLLWALGKYNAWNEHRRIRL
jgi:hypothetical protein